jgi:two-component system sensor histidine kinase CpxA
MRSIFLKIFVAFWIAQVLSLAFVVARTNQIFRSHQVSEDARNQGMLEGAFSINTQRVIESFERHDSKDINTQLRDVQSRWGITLYIVDAAGHEIRGAQIPADLEHVLQEAGGRRMRKAEANNSELITESFVSRAGHNFAGVARIPHPPVLRFPLVPPWGFRWHDLSFLVASGLIAFGLAYLLTRPILRLRNAAQRLAAGDLTARAPEKARHAKGDEVANLTHDFNVMAERVECLIAAQRTLISDISHELRTPLARLGMALGLARQRSSAEAQSWLDRIEIESDRLNGLIEKLLSLSRLENDLAPLRRESVDVTELMRTVVEDSNFEASLRDCRVTMEDSPSCSVSGNTELLQSAFENVVRNAVKYTAERSEVTVRVEHQEGQGKDWCRISVRDHGPGVPETELADVFRPFYRVDSARARETGGVGLGLAIAQRAVNAHGGTIEASNLATGGLCLAILLPSAPTRAEVQAALERLQPTAK